MPEKRILNGYFFLAIFIIVLSPAFQIGYQIGGIDVLEKKITNWIEKSYMGRFPIEQHGYEIKPPIIKTNITTKPTSKMKVGWNGTISRLNKTKLDNEIKLSPNKLHTIWFFITFALYLGGFIGCFLMKLFEGKLGKINGLLINVIFIIIGVSLEVGGNYAESWEILIISQIFIGIHAAIGCGLSIMYLQEISPQQYRGTVSSIFMFIVTGSVLLARLIGLESIIKNWEWSTHFCFTLVPIFFPVLGKIISVPDSQKYLLIEKNKGIKVYETIDWPKQTVEFDKEYKHAPRCCSPENQFLDYIWTNPILRKQFWLGFLLISAQQLSGFNAVFFYSKVWFSSTNLDLQLLSIYLGIINFCGAIISLLLIEELGRKNLILFGNFIMIGSLVLLTICLSMQIFVSRLLYVGLAATFIYIAGFSIGPGAVPMILICEMAPQATRSLAVACGLFWSFSLNFTVSVTYPLFKGWIQVYVFLIYVTLLIVSQVLIWRYIPETRGKSEIEIQDIFHGRARDLPK